MTALVKLITIHTDSGGYTVYIFKCLEEEMIKQTPYIMCTRYPNWNHRNLKVGEIGYLEYLEIYAGTHYYNVHTGKDEVYKYSNIQFIRFIEKEEDEPQKYIM